MLPMKSKPGTTLKEELERHPGKTVFLGARSSFFFVGPSSEALMDLILIDRMERAYAEMICGRIGFAKADADSRPSSEPIENRPVAEVYVRESGEEGELVIIVEGREFGAFWTRAEYLEGRDAFRKALDRATVCM